MTKKHLNRHLCRNQVMPRGLTEAFRERILNLRSSVRTDYLKREVFSKYVSIDTDPPEVRRNRAIFKWLCTEQENEATNIRLLTTSGEYNILPRVRFDSFVSFCRDLIIEIIGECPPTDVLIGSFSGGASTSRNRTESHPAQKYLGQAHATKSALARFEDYFEELPGWINEWNDVRFDVVPGNVLFTVPKKTDIDRVAAKEPDLNMFMQKGVGDHFRDRLRRIGINLRDQSNNRNLARIGSIDGSLATLDLSSASDSVTVELVAMLLPEFWYALLADLRSPVTLLPDGETHRNEMFSSMGNGFTFELESLLFYVLTRAACFFGGHPGKVSVYGDDIICPSSSARDVIEVLSYMGFSTNEEKSFTEGPFRESCGGHFYDGYDVTPFYVKAPLERMTDVIDVANKLRAWAAVPYYGIQDPEVEDIWYWLKSYVPSYLWGGEPTTAGKYQLVSSDLPQKRLHQETKTVDTGSGGYVHWLNATWDRLTLREGVETSSRAISLGRFRLIKVKQTAVPRLATLWPRELWGDRGDPSTAAGNPSLSS